MRMYLFVLIAFFIAFNVHAAKLDEVQRLKLAYPDNIKEITPSYITWKDGTRMLIRSPVPFADLISSHIYHINKALGSISKKDVIRDRYEPFFRKMYGSTAEEVKKHLVTIYWMPKVFGKRYPLRVTAINGIDKKLQHISSELEKLPPAYLKFVTNPAGAFYWRNVSHENYLSTHSFGIAVDINSHYTNYWLWDHEKSHKPVSELGHHNQVPQRIVEIFEKEGFFWGGRWRFYDTMHFEYRPEFFIPT
ncbi:MAG: hypothetical protein A3E84_00465 [Gammaproteobacteria bacterium RIFCSPHIGHO2_12_FULL_42_13]|nr:MAG: hypothetical protein A3E84_00465 [Gammaproteobacteria bacterium RIFCSPHIGHO2_12_FULL_42_13]